MKMRGHRFNAVLVLFALGGVIGCTDTLVYGERSGVNIGIISDAAKSTPLEVNVGLHRRVVGIIPAKGNNVQNNRASGEAANMISNFSMSTVAGESGPFSNKITIGSRFVSGQAAVQLANNNQGAEIAQVVMSPSVSVSVSRDEAVRAAQQRIVQYINASPANLKSYLDFAQASGMEIPPNGPDGTKAMGAIFEAANTAKNVEFSKAIMR